MSVVTSGRPAAISSYLVVTATQICLGASPCSLSFALHHLALPLRSSVRLSVCPRTPPERALRRVNGKEERCVCVCVGEETEIKLQL